MARLVSPSKSDQTRSMNQSGNGPSPSLPPAQSVRDDGIQPPRVGSAPVRSPARPAAEEPVVRAERAVFDHVPYLFLGNWFKHAVARQAPGPRRKRWVAPVQHVEQLLVGVAAAHVRDRKSTRLNSSHGS